MNSENIILRNAIHSPLTTKGDFLSIVDFDDNNINIYEDFNSLASSGEIADFDVSIVYDDTLEKYVTYNGRSYMYINDSATMGNLPTDASYWIEIFPTYLAHQKNRDTILDEGGVDEVSANEIRAFIDGGLTTTTNLSISGHTSDSLNINSSTGTDVTLNAATRTASGLLSAANKIKLDNLTGVNTGDQTLASLNAEDVDNKVNDFTIINSVLYPTTEAVDAYLTTQVPPLVSSALTGVEIQTNKDATGGYVGMTLFKINFKNALNTFTSFFTNSNTAARTYTFQDRNGTIADDTDLALKLNKASVPVIIQLAVSDETTALTTGAGKVTFRMPHAMTLTGVRASLTTAQTSGSTFTADVKQNGSSVFVSNFLEIDNTEKTSVTASNQSILGTTALTDDSEITIDVSIVGDGTAKGLKITLIGTRSV